jgi:hypothetical protein
MGKLEPKNVIVRSGEDWGLISPCTRPCDIRGLSSVVYILSTGCSLNWTVNFAPLRMPGASVTGSVWFIFLDKIVCY